MKILMKSSIMIMIFRVLFRILIKIMMVYLSLNIGLLNKDEFFKSFK